MSGPELKPVEESIAMVGGEVAVGEDLPFQRRWWRFERVAWSVFTILLVLDLLGVFGRGPLAHRHGAPPTAPSRCTTTESSARELRRCSS